MTKPSQQNALIGHTGFVGQALAAQTAFTATFNRSNIASLGTSRFDLAVCAAAPGSMFEANRFPEQDESAVQALIKNLGSLQCDQFVLISTIAVYASFDGQDDEGSTAFQTQTPYGKNRRMLETFCADHFEHCTIIRLPALFGAGLKKNFLFDMMNPVPSMLTADKLVAAQDTLTGPLADLMGAIYTLDDSLGLYCVDRAMLGQSADKRALEHALVDAQQSALGFTNPDTQFQFYPMSRIWSDCQRAVHNQLPAANLATEPMRAGDVFKAMFGTTMQPNQARLHKEDMRTKHADVWGQDGTYIETADKVLPQIIAFMKSEMDLSG